MQASAGRRGRRAEKIELPAVLTGAEARGLAEEALARTYRRADRVKLSLPPPRMTLRPGDVIGFSDGSEAWAIRSVTIDGLSIDIEAEAVGVHVPMLPADPGRPASGPDEPIGRTELLLFEAPPSEDAISVSPMVYVAASGSGAWKPVPLELRLGSDILSPAAIRRPATIGRALTALAPGALMVRDEISSVTVELASQSAILLNADEDALLAGANLAILGGELIQFGRAEEVAAGIYRLSRLLRGVRGTEWAAEGHAIGEPFCLIGHGILPVELGANAIGASLTAIAHGVGDVAPFPEEAHLVTGEAMRAPSPCHLRLRREGDGVAATWTRRSHGAWTWLDEVGSPEDPFAELYRVTVEGPLGTLSMESAAPTLTLALPDVPAGPGDAIELTVATVGPKAISHGISATLTL